MRGFFDRQVTRSRPRQNASVIEENRITRRFVLSRSLNRQKQTREFYEPENITRLTFCVSNLCTCIRLCTGTRESARERGKEQRCLRVRSAPSSGLRRSNRDIYASGLTSGRNQGATIPVVNFGTKDSLQERKRPPQR